MHAAGLKNNTKRRKSGHKSHEDLKLQADGKESIKRKMRECYMLPAELK